MVINISISLYCSRLLLEVLGVQNYGIYNAVCGFVLTFSFINTALSNGVQRFYNFELAKNGQDGAQQVFNTSLLIQCLLVLVSILPLEAIGIWYIEYKINIPHERLVVAHIVFQLATVSFILHIIQVPFIACVIAHERMRFYAFINIFQTLLSLFAISSLKLYKYDCLLAYSMSITVIALIVSLVYFLYCKAEFEEIKLAKLRDRSLLRKMLSFSSWNVFGTMGQMSKEQGVDLLLNLYYGPVINASRAIANQINAGIQSFVANIIVPVRPQIIKSYSEQNVHRSINLTFTISKICCYIVILVSTPIVLDIDYVLTVWLYNNIPCYTSSIISIIILSSLISNLNAGVSCLIHASGNMKIYQISGALVNLTSTLVAYFVLEKGGAPRTVFTALFIVSCIGQIFSTVILKKIIPDFSYIKYLKEVLLPISFMLLFVILSCSIIGNFISPGFVRFLLAGIVTFFVFIIHAFTLGFTKSEIQIIKQLTSILISKTFKSL